MRPKLGSLRNPTQDITMCIPAIDFCMTAQDIHALKGGKLGSAVATSVGPRVYSYIKRFGRFGLTAVDAAWLAMYTYNVGMNDIASISEQYTTQY